MSFATFVLERLPELRRRLAEPDATRWLATQDSVDIDGERMWIVGGDRLIDEAEAKLEWARGHGLVDEAVIQRLQAEYPSADSSTIAIDPA